MSSNLLDFPVPLKEGESHCPYCAGHGRLPEEKNNPRESLGKQRCYKCEGTGKAIWERKRNI